MSWVYKKTEIPSRDNDFQSLYTVGFYEPDGKWHSDSDWTNQRDAGDRCHYLNGGNKT